MKLNLKAALLIIGLTSAIATTSMGANFCVGSSKFEPEFGMVYYYSADCSWSTKAIWSETMALVGFTSTKAKQNVKAKVVATLASKGLTKILQVGKFDVYSDTSVIGNDMCLNYNGNLSCTPNAVLNANVLKSQSLDQTLKGNGFTLVSRFKAEDKLEVSIYVK